MSQGIAAEITILMTTLNRPEFVVRALNYLADTEFGGRVLIGDASQADLTGPTQGAISALRDRIRIDYHHLPGLSGPKTIAKLLALVGTRYTAWIADDDFLVPATLAQCAQVLESRPEVSIVHGQGVLVKLKTKGAYGPVQYTASYVLRDLNAPSPSKRLLEFLENYYVTVFSLRRTRQMIEAYQDQTNLSDWALTELLPGCMAALQGNNAQVKSLYLVRQVHDARYLLSDSYDWLTRPQWQPSYQVFEDRLTKTLTELEGMTAGDARQVVKQAFWTYLSRSLSRNWKDKYQAPTPSRLRRWARQVPVMQKAWRAVRDGLDPFSHSALTRSSSPYYGEYLPIYRAMTEGSVSAKRVAEPLGPEVDA